MAAVADKVYILDTYAECTDPADSLFEFLLPLVLDHRDARVGEEPCCGHRNHVYCRAIRYGALHLSPFGWQAVSREDLGRVRRLAGWRCHELHRYVLAPLSGGQP